MNVASICEQLAEPLVQVTFCPMRKQRANFFTKVISPQKWPAMLEQLCLSDRTVDSATVAAPSQNTLSEDPLAGSDPKSAAGILQHKLAEQHRLQLFCLLLGDNSSRPVVSTESKGFTVVVYAQGGGIVGLRSNTSKFRGVATVLTRFIWQHAKNLTFTAVAIYQGCQLEGFILASATILSLTTSFTPC